MKSYAPNMLQQTSSLSFLILSFMFSGILGSTGNPNVYFQCSKLNFTSSTPYESNVGSLFTSLVDSASVYNFNKFETSPQSDCVYGLFQCRGDLSSTNCKDCVANAISQLKTVCPTSTGGEIQLEGCFVKYDDTSFFGADDKTEVCKNCGPSIGYNSDVLNRIDSALAYLVGGNGQYFRGGDFGSIQGVAQCVQDLSLSDCQDCLSEASGRLRSECATSTWGDMYLGKCYIRYADQGNLDLGNNNGDSTSNKRSKGDKIKKTVLIWSIIGSILVGVGATIALSCACQNCCNITAYMKKTKKLKFEIKVAEREKDSAKKERNVAEKERDSAKTEAKSAKEKAEKLQKERDLAKTETKEAKEKADKLDKENKELIKKCVPCIPPIPPPCPYLPLPPPLLLPPCPNYLPVMPPPCPYMPHSSRDACYYL